MDQQFAMKSEVRGACVILTTSGYINNVGGEAIAAECLSQFARGVKHVVLNLEQSRVVNSIGMSYIIEVIEQLQESGGTMMFTNLDAAVDKMLAIMGIFKFAKKVATVDDAVSVLASDAPEEGKR
jgi:anti-anti-sigma factor